ncbi:hypothetical protein CE139_24960 [Pseudomonas oryzihabitans]|uniref:Uncharacterized protein n=2 Tax=Pseudomonas oryzihabitans TaxID=47885 RepID=A0A2Z5AID2_9PSED|nr:hypothetical protein CE139_24960 [Pseudomonas oryzihabitans]
MFDLVRHELADAHNNAIRDLGVLSEDLMAAGVRINEESRRRADAEAARLEEEKKRIQAEKEKQEVLTTNSKEVALRFEKENQLLDSHQLNLALSERLDKFVFICFYVLFPSIVSLLIFLLLYLGGLALPSALGGVLKWVSVAGLVILPFAISSILFAKKKMQSTSLLSWFPAKIMLGVGRRIISVGIVTLGAIFSGGIYDFAKHLLGFGES